MLYDALHNPGGVHKQVFHLCMRLCVPENGGISEISPDLNYIDSFTDVLKHFISLFVICIFCDLQVLTLEHPYGMCKEGQEPVSNCQSECKAKQMANLCNCSVSHFQVDGGK